MPSWLAEESSRQKKEGLFVSVFAPEHPKRVKVANLCDRCLKDAFEWLNKYRDKRREETKDIMWKNLEDNL